MDHLLREHLLETIAWIHGRGWAPATGGNFSLRLPEARVLMTASGRDKGQLTSADLLQVNLAGQAIDSHLQPSAETLLHCALYRLDSDIGAVLHTHSVASTVLSLTTLGDWLVLRDLEMQKALAGNTSHEQETAIAIVDNDQDMARLARGVEDRWPLHWGLLVRGHGLYAWGQDLTQARRHLEALEFLFACALELRRLGASPS